MSSGDLIAANAMTEPGAGSDAFGLTTTATRDGSGYVLDGVKTFITNAPVAGLFLVFARVPDSPGDGITAFLVERDAPGLRIGAEIDKMGLGRPR